MYNLTFESHFKDLFESTSDLIYFLTLDGIIQSVNPAWKTTLGYEISEVIDRSIYDFIHPSCIEDYKTARKLAIYESGKAELVTNFVAKSGKELIMDGHIGCIYNMGNPISTRGIFKNVTEKKLAEKKLEDSEKRLKTFFRSGPDAVIVINQQQVILEWNPKAEDIFGYTAHEVTGTLLSNAIIPQQYREAHKTGMSHFLKTGEAQVLNKTIEITALHKKGHEFYINLSISSVKIDGEWIFIAFLSDITARKQTEQELILKEAELLQTKFLEEKKDEFITVASHELKTPLTTLKAYAQIVLTLSKEEKYEPVRQYIAKIDQSADKLNYLLTELLDVSRIHAGKLILSPTEVCFDSFLLEVLTSMQHTIKSHKIILEKNESFKTKIDTLRIEQVIANIVSNAAKYSPGREKIIVNSTKKNNEIIVSFRDFGIGIPNRRIDEIFNRFYRVDESSKFFSGLGIGLYISSEIIKEHGGSIWVESIEELGSTFYISLPLINNN